MAEQKQQYKTKGEITGVEIKEGSKQDGSIWKRAGIKVSGKESSITVATFNSDDITKAEDLKGRYVEITYTKNDNYKNLVKGGIALTQPPEGHTPGNAGQATTGANSEMSKGEWAEKDKMSQRSMAISYAKDMFCAGKIAKGEIISTADELYNYIWNGKSENKQETKPETESKSEEMVVEEEVVG